MSQSIITEKPGMIIEDFLQPHSVEEEQEKEIHSSNAKSVYNPEFIPFYADIARTFELTHIETVIYGFIRFYSRFNSNRFYFTDEQLAYIAMCNDSTAGKAVNKLKKVGLLTVHHKIKAGGGTIRFVEFSTRFKSASSPDWTRFKSASDPLQKRTNKNKINKNNLLKRIDFIVSFGNSLPEDIKKEIQSDPFLKKKYQHLLEG